MSVVGRAPEIHYAKSGDLNIACSVTGDGPDLVVAPGFISHLEVGWEEPSVVHFYSRLATFRRVISFDKRGTGLSDPWSHAPTLEECVDDVRAVMDATGSERADVLGVSEGGTMATLFAASHPDRVNALVLYGTYARLVEAPDYPFGVSAEGLAKLVDISHKGWGEGVGLGAWRRVVAATPSFASGGHGCSASRPARGWCGTSLPSIPRWTSATCCRRSRRRRSSCTVAPTGW